MALTVEPGVYVARDKATVTLTHAAYDPDERLRLPFELGPAGARAELERRDAEAGTIEHEVPPEYLGIGVRIEDDLLLTADGHENLSAGSPVEADAVEAVCAEPSRLPLFD